MRRVLFYLLIYVLPLISKAQSDAYSVPFSFKLPESCNTSAGVFSNDGSLIRTLWNNVESSAGTYNKVWDGLDDDGNLANKGDFKITIQTNNVKYEWEGARIGNTSKDLAGGNKHRAYSPAASMVIDGNNAYYCTGFNEGTSSLHKFNLDNKQVIKRILNMSGHQISATNVATDGKLVYWAGFDSWNSGTWPAFIVATKVSDDTENIFETGQSVTMKQGRTYNSAINVDQTTKVTGLAVTRGSNYLFVSHASANELRVINKTTGKLIRTITVSSPGLLLVDRSDKFLWLLDGDNKVKKFPINSDGTLGKAALALSEIVKPLAFDISPDNSIILISDGNNGSEVVKAFSTSSGNMLWSFGKGSYETDPNVKNDKFYLVNRNSAQGAFKTFVSFEPNGSFWIGDSGNHRMQHYTAERTYIDRIMYLRQSYNSSADKNNPTKVFNEYMEFKIDYSKPLATDNGSWELVRNYRASLKTDSYGKDEMRAIFKSVVTLSNGRTYATLRKNNRYNIVELPENAPIRFTGIEFEKDQSVLIMKDGSLRSYVNRREPKLASFYTQDLKGFDANNNPIWYSKYALSEIPVIRSDPHDYLQNRNGQSTKSGLLISFNKGAGVEDTGYHLGAIKEGDSKWLWKTSKATSKNYKGDFPKDGYFDIGNGVTGHSAGAGVFVVDNNIFWNYNGEFWKNAQTNYWNHFSDKGLMVGQFGIWRDEIGNLKRGPAMMAGNAFSGEVVKVGDNIYVYQNDESQHSGTHRWKISGLNTIKEISVPIKLDYSGKGLRAQYYKGKDLDNTNIKTTRIDSVINFNWLKEKPPLTQLTEVDNFSVSWTGFVTPLYSELYTFFTKADDGVRLWVDGKLLIEDWKDKTVAAENSENILLAAGKRYTIRLEYYEKQGNSSVSLLWKSLSQSKEVIPSTNLTPTELEDSSSGTYLMYKLSTGDILKNGLYGWHRSPAIQDSSDYYGKWWNVNTIDKSTTVPVVFINYRQPRTSNNYSVTRNLGDVGPSISSWNLSGKVDFSGNYPNTSGGGSYIEVLDDAGKIITRIYTYSDKLLSLFLNNSKTRIAQGNAADINAVINNYQFVEIKGSPNGITVRYGPYPSVTAPVFDPESNWKKPKTFRLSFFTGSKNSGRTISVEGFRFKTEEGNPSETINKTNQSIDFPKVESKTHGESFTIKATASSNLPVTYVVKSGPATVVGNKVTLTGAGTIVIEAHQLGNDKYNIAEISNQSFTVNKASQSIAFADLSEKKIGDPAFTLTAVASSKLPMSYKIKSGPAKLSGDKVSLTGTGTVVIDASQAGNTNFNPAAMVTKSFVVNKVETADQGKGSQAITFGSLSAKKITDAPFTLSATASSKLPVAYNVKSGPATISGNKVTLTGAGTVVIEAHQNGNDKFNAAIVLTQSFTVSKAAQTITIADLSEKKKNDPAFSLTGEASSGLPLSYRIKSGPAKIAGNQVSLTGVGTVVIEVSQGGDSDFNPAETVTKSFVVKEAKGQEIVKSNQTITFPNLSAKKATDAPFTLNATATSKLPVAYRVKSGPATVSGNKVTLTGGGIVVIEALQSGNSKYNAALAVSKSFTVNKVAQIIAFGKLSDKKATDAPFTLTATSSSKLPVVYRIKSGPAKISGTILTLTGSGTVVIEANQAGNSAYNAAPMVPQTLIVAAASNQTAKKATQTITFPDKVGMTTDEASVTVMATASSGLIVSYRIKSGPAKVSGNTVTINNVGTVLIEAFQPGNDKFNPAPTVTRSFIIGANSPTVIVKLDQTISFSAIGTRYKKEQFTLDASSSSGLPIIYRIISGLASINGNKITLTDIGTVVVEASQTGNHQYNKAASKSQTFKVNGTSQKTGVNSDNFFSENSQNLNDEVNNISKFDVTIYPNPASTNTTVEFVLEETSDVNLELFNLQGMLIKRISLGLNEAKVSNTYKLDTENLPAGVYIIRVLSKNVALSRRLLIIK